MTLWRRQTIEGDYWYLTSSHPLKGGGFLFNTEQMRCHPHATASRFHGFTATFVASLTTLALEFYAVVWQPVTPMLRRFAVLILLSDSPSSDAEASFFARKGGI